MCGQVPRQECDILNDLESNRNKANINSENPQNVVAYLNLKPENLFCTIERRYFKKFDFLNNVYYYILREKSQVVVIYLGRIQLFFLRLGSGSG